MSFQSTHFRLLFMIRCSRLTQYCQLHLGSALQEDEECRWRWMPTCSLVESERDWCWGSLAWLERLCWHSGWRSSWCWDLGGRRGCVGADLGGRSGWSWASLGLVLGLVPVSSKGSISSPMASSLHVGPSQVRDGYTLVREVPEALLAFTEAL